MNPLIKYILTETARTLFYFGWGVFCFMAFAGEIPMEILLTVVFITLLLLAYIWLCWKERSEVHTPKKRKRAPHYSNKLPVRSKPRAQLELFYMGSDTVMLVLPVNSVEHAQDLIQLLDLEEAAVGYVETENYQTKTLFKTDANRVLRRV